MRRKTPAAPPPDACRERVEALQAAYRQLTSTPAAYTGPGVLAERSRVRLEESAARIAELERQPCAGRSFGRCPVCITFHAEQWQDRLELEVGDSEHARALNRARWSHVPRIAPSPIAPPVEVP